MAKKPEKTAAGWTVMVLMGADTLDNEGDLSDVADSDLAEMMAVEYPALTPPPLHVVVQLDKRDASGPKRYSIDTQGLKPLGEADDQPVEGEASSAALLEDFVSWARRKHRAQHYMLVLWGHAYQLAFNRDPGDPDGLDFPELQGVLERTNDGQNLDIVAFDSCNVSLIEAAYQLRGVAHYLLASQFTDPLPGWPYEIILGRLVDPKRPFAGPEGAMDFGRTIVSQFVRHYAGQKNATMTMLDLTLVPEVGQRIGDLARELALAVDASPGELDVVQDIFRRSQVPVNQPSVDLATFCWHLLNFSGSDSVRTAAADLGDLLLRPTCPFIVAHAKSDLLVAMLHGVSILAPNVMSPDEVDLERLRAKYETLDLVQETLWGNLVFALAEPEA